MAIIDYWNLPEDQRRGMDILIREGLYPPPLPPQPRGPGVPVFRPQGGSIPLPRNWDWTAMESEYPPFPQPPSQGSRPQARPILTVDPYPSSAPSYQEAASAARTRQAYAAGMDDYFPGLRPPRRMPKPPDAAGMDDYFPGLKMPDKMPNASASAKGFTAGGRIAPGTIAHSLTNLGPVDALFSLGSAPFTYAGYKSFGATNPQALIGTIGTEGGGVFGGLAGARLGATAGSLFGPIGATGGAILGAVIGGQAGFRLGGKAADELSGLNEANRMRQQQQFYDPATSEVYMPPPPPTPQERMRNEILSSAQNPYMPYMMAQLGGYYA